MFLFVVDYSWFDEGEGEGLEDEVGYKEVCSSIQLPKS